MYIANLVNHHVQDYVDHVGPAGVFSRYVVAQKPQSPCVAVRSDQQVLGTAISGRMVGLDEVSSHWVFAHTPDAAAMLASALRSATPAINFPLSYLDAFQATYPDRAISTDLLYLLPASQFKNSRDTHTVMKLSAEILKQVHIDAELQPLIGAVDAYQGERVLYGIVQDSAVLRIGDVLVQDRYNAVIQQLYTLLPYRGQGLGQSLVRSLVRLIMSQHKLPLYVVAEDNVPSRHIVEKLGFKLDSCWGYLT